MAEALSGASGIEFTIRDMLAVGARAQTLCHLFNLRAGLAPDDDKHPKRVIKAFQSGPLEGIEINEESFAWAKKPLYE